MVIASHITEERVSGRRVIHEEHTDDWGTVIRVDYEADEWCDAEALMRRRREWIEGREFAE